MSQPEIKEELNCIHPQAERFPSHTENTRVAYVVTQSLRINDLAIDLDLSWQSRVYRRVITVFNKNGS